MIAVVRSLAAAGQPGGRVDDAVVGLTARRAQARLVTADHHAGMVYDLVGVAWSHLGDPPADS